MFDLVPCLQSVGISSCLPLCCPSISLSVDLCSVSQKLLVSAISHRCGCVLASSTGQTVLNSLLFSRKISTGFMCVPFLMSLFLMWSNLVFPLANLNILISAEFIKFASFFLFYGPTRALTNKHDKPLINNDHVFS